MVIRELTSEEKKMTEKGITKLRSEITELDQDLMVFEKQKEFIKVKREYEDYMRPYTREKQDREITDAIKHVQADIKLKQASVEEMERQLKEGVEEKNSMVK